MASVLDEIERAQQQQALTDIRLHSVRESLAAALGMETRALRLSGLIPLLEGRIAAEIDARRRRITRLAEEVRKRNLQAAVILSECARINHLLLQSLFPRENSVTTYGAKGSATWRSGVGVVDAEQ
jgi:flagellar biosynthesis/type III secretory pathway chaperone